MKKKSLINQYKWNGKQHKTFYPIVVTWHYLKSFGHGQFLDGEYKNLEKLLDIEPILFYQMIRQSTCFRFIKNPNKKGARTNTTHDW